MSGSGQSLGVPPRLVAGTWGYRTMLEDHVGERAHDETLSLKEIKVRIPVAFHLKLHAFKVLKGKPISDTIVEALDAYFKAADARRVTAQVDLPSMAPPANPPTQDPPPGNP
jgi:hypothetical protein